MLNFQMLNFQMLNFQIRPFTAMCWISKQISRAGIDFSAAQKPSTLSAPSERRGLFSFLAARKLSTTTMRPVEALESPRG